MIFHFSAKRYFSVSFLELTFFFFEKNQNPIKKVFLLNKYNQLVYLSTRLLVI